MPSLPSLNCCVKMQWGWQEGVALLNPLVLAEAVNKGTFFPVPHTHTHISHGPTKYHPLLTTASVTMALSLPNCELQKPYFLQSTQHFVIARKKQTDRVQMQCSINWVSPVVCFVQSWMLNNLRLWSLASILLVLDYSG